MQAQALAQAYLQMYSRTLVTIRLMLTEAQSFHRQPDRSGSLLTSSPEPASALPAGSQHTTQIMPFLYTTLTVPIPVEAQVLEWCLTSLTSMMLSLLAPV